MRKIKYKFLHSSKLILLGLTTLALNGCGAGEEETGSSYVQDSVVQVVARDAVLNTELASDAYTVDLSNIVLEGNSSNAFRLSDVSVINNDSSCNPTSIAQHSFTVRRNQAKVCDYAYAVVATNQTEESSAMVRVVVSNDENYALPPLSQVALINESNTTTDPAYSYEPITINLVDELKLAGTDVSGWSLSSSVTQPFAKGSTVVVDTVKHVIQYTPAPGETGIDRLMYSYTDNTQGQAYSGSIDIAVAENANQGIELLEEHVIYTANGKSYMPLADAIKGVTIDVSPYVSSIDGDDIQLIYVKSLTAPLTEITSAQASSMTNMSFTFKASTQNVHAVTYVVSDHKGSYQIGHISVTVLDESTLPPWVDVTHTPSNTLFYAPKSLNVAIANSYPFNESISARESGKNYMVAGLYSSYVEDYCYQLGAEIATSEELKSLVDRGWLANALWPTAAEYLVIDRASGNFNIIDTSAGAYSIDTAVLRSPDPDIAYFPACVVRSAATDRMLTSLQLTAKLRAGTSSISVPNGKSLNTTLTGYFNDGSVESDMWAFDSRLTTFEQSNDILTHDSLGFTAHTMGNTDLYGQYNAGVDPLRSNITNVQVIDAIAISGSVNLSSKTAPQGTEITLDGIINYSDSTSASVSDEANVTWMLDGTEFSGSHSLVESILYDGSSWKLKVSSTNKGSVKVGWKIDGVSSNTETLIITDAIIESLESIVAKDSITDIEAISFPIGRSFYFTVMAKFTDGTTRDISTDIAQGDWEANVNYLTQSTPSYNEFTGHTAHSWNNSCGGVGIPVRAWINGLSICGSVEITDAYLVSVDLTPTTHSLPKGTTVQITANGTYSDGDTKSINGQCSWVSSNTGRGTVNQSGLVSTNASSNLGNTTVTATCSSQYETFAPKATITVTAAELVSIDAEPSIQRASRLEKVYYTATGTYTDGTTSDLSKQVTWATDITYGNVHISSNSVYVGIGNKRSSVIDLTASLNGITSNGVQLKLYNSFIVESLGMIFTLPHTSRKNYDQSIAWCQSQIEANANDWGPSSRASNWRLPNMSILSRLYSSGYGPSIVSEFQDQYYENSSEKYIPLYWSSERKPVVRKGYIRNLSTNGDDLRWITDSYNFLCYQSL